jgi:hypothetical protein
MHQDSRGLSHPAAGNRQSLIRSDVHVLRYFSFQTFLPICSIMSVSLATPVTVIDVEKFNALPRTQTIPKLSIRNEWYFDIRYLHFEPAPAHYLVVIQPKRGLVHRERLPLGTPEDNPGYLFFPETAEECAPEICKALIHVFITSLDISKLSRSQNATRFAPKKLFTIHKSTSIAVNTQLRSMGVDRELCTARDLGLESMETIMAVEVAWEKHFTALKQSFEIPQTIAAGIPPPDTIGWHEDRKLDFGLPKSDIEKVLAYAQKVQNSRPQMLAGTDSDMMERMRGEMYMIDDNIKAKSFSTVKKDADNGDPVAAMDCAMRCVIIPSEPRMALNSLLA